MEVTRSPDENELAALGRSTVLTDAGWEEAEYLEPEPDWRLIDDGSYLSPDALAIPAAGPPGGGSLADYDRSGYRVVSIVGVDGSPSCGVQRTLDSRIPGQALFIDALSHQLRRRRLPVPLYAHDLAGELGGQRGVDAALQRALVR